MEDKSGNVYKPDEDLTKCEKFCRAIWNSQTREFCGRTGLSWFKITVFYIIFYACLAAFWSCMLVVFYQTISKTEPKWQLGSSRIGTSPGLGFRPFPPDDNVDSTLIWYNVSKPETVQHYVDNLNKYLKPYNQTNGVGFGVKTCGPNETATETQVCHFPVPEGRAEACSAERSYGFNEGKPCILVKLNRIYGWSPEKYDGELPKKFKEQLEKLHAEYDPDSVYVTCEGENSADKDNIGKIEYQPPTGAIHKKFYPFYNQDGYVSPFVFVQFANVNRGVLVNVECRAWAKNIKFDRGDRLGSVHFELLVD